MTYTFLNTGNMPLPAPESADQHGIVAIGGDLSPRRLHQAYHSGIFPWYSESEPIIWWSPDPRFVLLPERFKLGRSLRKIINRGDFEIRWDTAFDRVIGHCSSAPRPDQDGTWITSEMQKAYIRLHRLGLAHSVESWRDGVLVGGLYGVAMGPFFFGESMFHLAANASKVALAALTSRYRNAPFIDCQVHNDFFEAMGAEQISRTQFLETLRAHIDEPNHWHASARQYEPGPPQSHLPNP